MNLSKQQQEIVEAKENQIVVVASAAAGKTTILVERVRYLLNKGIPAKDIVLITFTNAAAEELTTRLGNPKGLFIGTIHAYANYLLLANGKETSDLIEQEQFDELIERINRNPGCIKPVKHLLLDESQDTNETHFDFLLNMIRPENYMFVGDWRQSIYRWNGAYPEFLIGLTEDPFVTTYTLTENYRNGSKILDFAKNIILSAGYNYRDNSTPMREIAGKVVEVEYSPIAIARTIKAMGDYKNWFILTRTNGQIDEMIWALTKEGVPCDTFKRASLDNKELAIKMEENTVKVLTIHTSKGLERDNVVVIGAKFFNTEEKCVSYVAATRAKNLLVWTRMPNKKRGPIIDSWER